MHDPLQSFISVTDINTSAFQENSLTERHWETGECFRKLNTTQVSDEFTWINLIKMHIRSVNSLQTVCTMSKWTCGFIAVETIFICVCTKVQEWKASQGSIWTTAKIACSDLPIHWTNLYQPLSHPNPSSCQIQSTQILICPPQLASTGDSVS